MKRPHFRRSLLGGAVLSRAWPGFWGLVFFLGWGVLLFGCETRSHSLEREERNLARHPLPEVPYYYRGVTYAEAAGVRLTLDVSAPEGEGPFPGLLVIHGGEWRLNTNRAMEGMARYITNRGYVVFNINTRMIPEVPMEKMVEDALGALVWAKEHAGRYQADPGRIAVTGDSSGGHLAAMMVTQAQNPLFVPTCLGQTDLQIPAAVISYGFLDFVSLGKFVPLTKRWLSKTYWEDPGRHELFSPLRHVRRDLPPQLVVVGDRDFLYRENLRYVEALRKAGAPVELYLAKGQAHGFLDRYWEEETQKAYDAIVRFLDRKLKTPTPSPQ